MELHQLTYFLTVARCGSVTRSASLLNVSQSTVSMAIGKLERELGVPLLEKQGRTVVLTPQGEQFAARISSPLAALESAKQELLDTGPERAGRISLSLDAVGYASELERLFLQQYPDIRFHQTFDTIQGMEERLLNGRVDFCLTTIPMGIPGVVTELLFQDRLFLLVGKDHPLAARTHMRLAEAQDEPFATMDPDYGFRRLTDQICFQAGFRPRVIFEGCELEMLTPIVRSSLAVTFVEETAWKQFTVSQFHDTQAVPLDDSFCIQPVYISRMKDRYLSKNAQQFYDAAMEFGRQAAVLHRFPTARELFP